MARLEIATNDETVTHVEHELELNRLEEGDNIPVPTPPRPGNGLISYGINSRTPCNYCKRPEQTNNEFRELERQEENKRNDGLSTIK